MRFLRFIHQVSLDVALGAMAYQAMFWWLRWHSFPPLAIQLLLFCSVWFVYLLDRLIDSAIWSIRDERHQFIQRNVQRIKVLLVLLSLVNVCCLFFVDQLVLAEGFLLVFLMGFYWWGWVRNWYRRYFSKETFTALLYVLGILLPLRNSNTLAFWLLGFAFFLLVLHHLKLFLQLAGKPSKSILKVLELLVLFLLFIAWWKLQVDALILISFLITLGVQLFIHYFYSSIRSRPLAEAAYWSPVICILYELFSK